MNTLVTCPECGAKSDVSTALGEDQQVHTPKTGDIVVCSKCALLTFVVDAETGECRASKSVEEFDAAMSELFEQLPDDISFGIVLVDRRLQKVRLVIQDDRS